MKVLIRKHFIVLSLFYDLFAIIYKQKYFLHLEHQTEWLADLESQ